MSLSEPDAAFLADRNLTFLFTRNADGSPAGWPMTSVLTGDGLAFSTYAKSAKVRACLAAGQATALVVRRAGDEIVRAVCVSGPVRLAEAGGQAAAPTAGSIDVPGHIRDRVQEAEAGGKRVVLALDVAAGASWSSGTTGEAAGAEA
jgi:hypothetical protein